MRVGLMIRRWHPEYGANDDGPKMNRRLIMYERLIRGTEQSWIASHLHSVFGFKRGAVECCGWYRWPDLLHRQRTYFSHRLQFSLWNSNNLNSIFQKCEMSSARKKVSRFLVSTGHIIPLRSVTMTVNSYYFKGCIHGHEERQRPSGVLNTANKQDATWSLLENPWTQIRRFCTSYRRYSIRHRGEIRWFRGNSLRNANCSGRNPWMKFRGNSMSTLPLDLAGNEELEFVGDGP